MRHDRLLVLTLCIEEAAGKRDWRAMQSLLDQRRRTVLEMQAANIPVSQRDKEQIEEINDRTWNMLVAHRRSMLVRLQKLAGQSKVKKAYASAR